MYICVTRTTNIAVVIRIVFSCSFVFAVVTIAIHTLMTFMFPPLALLSHMHNIQIEAELARGMMSLPAVKGFEIGEGFRSVRMTGSQHNDRCIA